MLCHIGWSALFKGVGHSQYVGCNADICNCWGHSDPTKDALVFKCQVSGQAKLYFTPVVRLIPPIRLFIINENMNYYKKILNEVK